MPKHVRSIECCYCSASTLVNLREVDEKSLKCGECGGGMAVDKMTHVAQPIATKDNLASTPPCSATREDRQLASQWKGKQDRRDDDDNKRKRKKSKRKKKKGFFDRLEDIWDEVEDIFD